MKKVSFWKKTKKRLTNLTKILGPGFITGSSDNDPSGIGTYSVAGAKYGLLLAWLVPFQLPLMYVIQEMCARIGLVTGKGLAANIKIVFSKPFLYVLISILVFANTINIGANISVMAASTKLILGWNLDLLAILITLIIILTEIFIPYHTYSKILLLLTIFLFSYVITAFIVTKNWTEILKHTFIPYFKFDRDFILIMTGFLGTTISPYLFFWQTSHEIEEKFDNEKTDNSKTPIKRLIKKMRLETFIGMFSSQIIVFFIVITCFSTLHLNGITEINSAYEAALALKPLAGEWAFILFTIGIVGLGFLSIPILAGSSAYAVSEVFNFNEGLSCKFKEAMFFYGIIILSSLIGLCIHFLDINPIRALIYAAILNGVAAIPLIATIVVLANKKQIMGKNKNGIFSNFIGWFTFAVMLLSAILVVIFWQKK